MGSAQQLVLQGVQDNPAGLVTRTRRLLPSHGAMRCRAGELCQSERMSERAEVRG